MLPEEKKKPRPESLMMSYGYEPSWSEGSLKSPIFATSTFAFETAEEGKRFFEVAYGLDEAKPGEKQGLIYSRINNPDLEIVEDRLTLWEEAESAALFESGMAAISTSLLTYLRPGDVLVHSVPIYGGTDHLATHVLPEFGIEVVRFHAGESPEDIEARIAETGGQLRFILIETPANPTNDLIDIAECTELAKRHSTDRQVLVAVDNTFLGPLWQKPLDLGADLSIYSATKYLGGHSDLIAGAVVGSEAVVAPIRAMRTFLGTMAGPWVSWLLGRSLETLQIRMQRQAETAASVARFLVEHPKVQKVNYLGQLVSGSSQEDIFKRQCTGPGAMISFEVIGGEPEAFRLLNNLNLVKLAVSLGGTESLAEHPASMTHADVAPAEQKASGVTAGLVRLSVGVEHPEDLIADLAVALDAV